MTTLTRISIVARKTIRFGIYLIIIATIVRISFGTLTSVWRSIFPPQEPEPTGGYGPMPELTFPEIEVGNVTYKLETPELTLPTFPNRMFVYRMNSPQSDIQALPDAEDMASKLGFVVPGTELVESVYSFDHVKEPAKLKVNIVNKNFSVSYDIRSNLSVISEVPPTPEAAQKSAESFLKRANLFTKDISGPVEHRFLRYVSGRYEEAISLAESDVIEVNLFRKNLEDKYPSKTPDPNQANIWFRFSNPQGGVEEQLVLAEYKHFPLNEQNRETYAILDSDTAWSELEEGNVSVISIDEGTQGEIAIRKVYLAYYDAGKFLPYFQPIIVFEGDNNFVGYLHAVDPNHVEGQEEVETTDNGG